MFVSRKSDTRDRMKLLMCIILFVIMGIGYYFTIFIRISSVLVFDYFEKNPL